MRRAAPIRIRSTPKYGDSGAHRTVSAEETWERLRPLLERIGITRVADITGLDRVGIPTYSVVRPTSKRAAVTVTCGKGTRRIDAKVGAVMESVEYKVAEPDEERGVIARMDELDGAVASPSEFNPPPWLKDASSKRFEWVHAWDIARDEPVWIPAAAAYILDPRGDFMFETESSGLASGNSVEEAICHALAEVIERDADSIAQSHAVAGTAAALYPLVALDSVPASSRSLAERFLRNDIDLYVRDHTSDLGVASFTVTCADRRIDKLLLHGGSGAHLVAEIALNRALTEAAQSRCADIQGSREDLSYFRRVGRDARELHPAAWQSPSADRTVRFDSVPSHRTSDVAEDIAVMIGRLRDRGFTRVAVVDLTSDELRIPTVRVVVPGLEIACVDPWRMGPRLAKGAARYNEERWSPR